MQPFTFPLTPGAQWENGLLCLPPQGGGLVLSPRDAATHAYLNLTLTVEEDHAMAFELRLWAAEEHPRVIIRFGVMPRYRTRIPLNMGWLDGHILYPGHVPGELKVVCHGSRIAPEEIRRVEWVSMPCFHRVRVRLEDCAWSGAPCDPAPVPSTPLVDEMGQYIPKDWPGKTRDPESLNTFLHSQARLPDAYPTPAWNRWGGCARRAMAPGTGYFTRLKQDGRWYLLDPEGCAFFSLGPDCVVARCDARIDGLEPLVRNLPDPGDPQARELYAPMEHPFGETPRGAGKLFSFERANLRRAFGDAWEPTWRRMVVAQLKQAGLNTLGNWSDEHLFGRMPYVTSLPRFPETAHKIFRDFPDVLSPEYREDAARCAQALLPRREDPFLVGYFLRNEPSWAFVDGLILADEVLRDPADTCCKAELIAFLRARYATPGALNAAWGSTFADFEDLRHPEEKMSARFPGAEADLRAFSRRLTEAYVSIPAQACRQADPHHMILGMRWAWISDPALAAGWENFDVFSINCYAVDPTPALERVRELGVDLPVMIGEFHFGALDAGLTATGLEAVPNQEERAAAFRYYVERVAAHPLGVGCHYFQCYDQFVLGRFDGENYNIGLFDICLRPYGEMLQASRACAESAWAIHAGEAAPTQRRPQTIPMIAY